MIRKCASTKELTAELETLRTAVAEIAAESWRYKLSLEKVLKRMDVMEAKRFARQYSYFYSRVDRAVSGAGLNVLDLTGQQYSVGLPVQAMNLEDFDEDEALIITQTVEPVIMARGHVMRTGIVMVDRVRGEN